MPLNSTLQVLFELRVKAGLESRNDGECRLIRIGYDRKSTEIEYGCGGGAYDAPMPLDGPVNQFTDIAEDLQYQFIGENKSSLSRPRTSTSRCT